MRKTCGRSRLVIACLAMIALTIVWTSSGVARANQLVTITIPDRHGEIPPPWLTYAGRPRADVLLPTGYNLRRRYPLLVLLPGFGNSYAILGPGELGAQKLLAGLQAIVVAPKGRPAGIRTGSTTAPTVPRSGRATSWTR